MPPSRKSDPAPPTVEPPPPAPGESNPWGAAAVRVPYCGGYILAAPGTDPAPLIEALDEHKQPREWAALGAELAALGSHRVRLAMHVARPSPWTGAA